MYNVAGGGIKRNHQINKRTGMNFIIGRKAVIAEVYPALWLE